MHNIYTILSSRPHNPHYLSRYIKFIESCKHNSTGEAHHIAPKSTQLFPEFKSFRLNPWNKIKLSLRQHYIAHLLLWKTYGGSQSSALFLMSGRSSNKSSRWYEKVKSENLTFLNKNNATRMNTGTHNFITNNPNKLGNAKSMQDKLHSDATKLKMSDSMKEAHQLRDSLTALTIYDNLNIPQFVCNHSTFKQICSEHDLPVYAFHMSYLNNGTPIYTDNAPKKESRRKFKGWYAIKTTC